MAIIKSRMAYGRLLEVVETSYGEYQLVYDGDIKQQSSDMGYILSEFDSY